MLKHNNKIARNVLLVLVTGLVIASCRKEVTPERVTSYTGKSYTEVFEAFWNGMNSHYVFWDVETVDWDNMYKTYKPRFEYLDQHKEDPKAAQKAIQYIVDMTKDLADSHLDIAWNGFTNYLISNYEINGALDFMPSSIRHQLRGDRPAIPRSVFDRLIPKHYLTKAESGTDGNGFHINLGLIPRNNKNILYLEFSNFLLEGLYYSGSNTAMPVKPVLDHFFQYTKDPSVDALIIDLRANTGGSVPDLDFLLGRLVTSPVHINYTKTKNGNGRFDYTPWIKGYVHPQPGSIDFDKPIAVLVDGNSVSMSEMTAMAVKAIFPKSKLIGEQTWGGTGQIPSNDVKYLGGQFTAANFLKVYFAGVQLRDKNMVCYENKGLTPDIKIAYDTTAIKRNVDLQLDKGIEYVTSH